MAKIEVKDIKLNGSELFNDSEGFMDELKEEVEQINGGKLIYTKPFPRPFPKPFPIPLPYPWPCSPVIL